VPSVCAVSGACSAWAFPNSLAAAGKARAGGWSALA
jgi:hypothetical protein